MPADPRTARHGALLGVETMKFKFYGRILCVARFAANWTGK